MEMNQKECDQRNYLVECRRDHANQYNEITDQFRKIHLLLNSGAAAALAIFFSDKETTAASIKIACIFFLVGIVLSCATYIWEFFTFYDNLYCYDEQFLSSNKDNAQQIEAKYQKYSKYQANKKVNSKKSIFRKIILNMVCYLFFFLGVLSLIINVLYR